jgi:hypothetical protein
MAKVLRFSRHFVARWAERKKSLPSLEEVNGILARSLRIVKQRILWERVADGVMVRHPELSHYWCHAAGVILLVDDRSGTAVTVITPDMDDKYGVRGTACE